MAENAWREGAGQLLAGLHWHLIEKLPGICSERHERMNGEAARTCWRGTTVQGLGALRDLALPSQQQRVAGDRRSGRQRVQHGGAVCGVQVDAVEH